MNVDQLITEVAKLGTSESVPDDERLAELLFYVNNAYQTLIDEVAQQAPAFFTTRANLTITNGVGTLPTAWSNVLQAWDTNSGHAELSKVSLEQVEAENPALDTTGTPTCFYQASSNELHTFPKAATASLSIRYLPPPAALLEGGAEDTIALPPQHHMAIVWGAVAYAIFDERDMGFNAEEATARRKYEMHKDMLKRWLRQSAGVKRRVKQWL